MRFVRLSPSGLRWVAEANIESHPIVLRHENGRLEQIGLHGIQPDWLDESIVICASTLRPVLHVWHLRNRQLDAEIPLRYTCNWLVARSGRWAAWAPPQPTAPVGLVVTDDGLEFPGYGAPALADNGDLFIVKDGTIYKVELQSREAIPLGGNGVGRLPRVARGGSLVAWIEDPKDGPPVIAPINRGRFGQAHYVLPLIAGGREFVCVVDADPDRAILYPVGDHMGYVVATGTTFDPDVTWLPGRQRVRFVATGADGGIRDIEVDLAQPRVDIRRVVAPKPDPKSDPKPDPKPEVPPMNTEFASFSWQNCAIDLGPDDVGRWPITATIRDRAYLGLDDKTCRFPWDIDRPWPGVVTSEGPDPLGGNIWVIAKPDARNWRAVSFDWLRAPYQDEKREDARQIAADQVQKREPWFSWRAQRGEVVGLMVTSLARGDERNGNERSGIVWVRIGTEGVIGREGVLPQPGPGPDPQPQPGPDPDVAALKTKVVALEQLVAQQAGRLEALQHDQRVLAVRLEELSALARAPFAASLMTDNGHFLCAEEGGGREVNATRTGPGPWETFIIERR